MVKTFNLLQYIICRDKAKKRRPRYQRRVSDPQMIAMADSENLLVETPQNEEKRQQISGFKEYVYIANISSCHEELLQRGVTFST